MIIRNPDRTRRSYVSQTENGIVYTTIIYNHLYNIHSPIFWESNARHDIPIHSPAIIYTYLYLMEDLIFKYDWRL